MKKTMKTGLAFTSYVCVDGFYGTAYLANTDLNSVLIADANGSLWA